MCETFKIKSHLPALYTNKHVRRRPNIMLFLFVYVCVYTERKRESIEQGRLSELMRCARLYNKIENQYVAVIVDNIKGPPQIN